MGQGSQLATALAVLFPVTFIGFWLIITTILGRMSGWGTLQELYPDRDDLVRARFGMQSASMGGAFGMPVNFNGCLTIYACANGVRFRVWRIFGPFLRPFFVPWGDISVDEKKVIFFRMARLRFARWQGGELTMRPARWNRIAAAAPNPALALPQ